MNSQFKKGVLEMCVVAILAEKDCYGYELVNKISENIEITEGTIYPLLRRLKKDKIVDTYLMESTEGPPRKYYKLTDSGRMLNIQKKNEWIEFVEKVNMILGGGK